MKQSQSYTAFKQRTQEIFEFAVLVTASVPILKQNLKLFTKGVIPRLPDPDYFEPSVIYEITDNTIKELSSMKAGEHELTALKELKNTPLNNTDFKMRMVKIFGETKYKELRNVLKRQSAQYVVNIENCATGYQSKLATYLYFSTFSYFEAYIKDVSSETIAMMPRLDKATYLANHPLSHDSVGGRIRLDKPTDPRKKNSYIRISERLDGKGYKIPEAILFSTMMTHLQEKIDSMMGNDIPAFLEKAFLYTMDAEDLKAFHSIRDNRNSIGHGATNYMPNLHDVIKTNKFLKKMATSVDEHIMFHFSKLKNYQKRR